MTKKALLLIDLQNDFCSGGSLAAPDADAVIPVANTLQSRFDLVIATQDWHPHNHVSFAINHPGHGVGDIVMVDKIPQVLWPAHCVQDSDGAKFHAQLDTSHIRKIFHKGADPKVDSYSAFFDNEHLRSTGLGDYLRQQGVDEVYIMGLVTEYCVKYSSLDAVRLGFKVNVILDGCRGVNMQPEDVPAAIAEMQAVGVNVMQSNEVNV